MGVTVECLPPDTATALLVDARRLELAGDALAAAPDARIVLPIGLATLRDREWLSVLAAHLGARPGIASRMIVALPEAVLVEKTKVLGRLDAMKALGIGLSLDGFGSGYATCARLRSLPIDLVTIDGVIHPEPGALDRRSPVRAHSRGYRPTSRHRHFGRMGGRYPERRHAAGMGHRLPARQSVRAGEGGASGRSDETGPAAGVKRSRSICAPVRPVSPACRPFAFSDYRDPPCRPRGNRLRAFPDGPGTA